MDGFYEEIKQAVGKLDKDEFSKLKIRLVKKYNLKTVPTNVDVFLNTGVFLQSKPMRTLSGVAPLALMTAPFACPHGKCVYCPGGPNSAFGYVLSS
jgi:elongator complex protein 3